MNKKILLVFVCMGYSILGSRGSVWATCINQYHDKLRTVQGEETKKYTCSVKKTVDAAFDADRKCTYCGCLRDFHDNAEKERKD